MDRDKVDDERLMDNNNNPEGSESDHEDDEDIDDEDYENQIKEDILRPASTRSKVVINLKEPENNRKGKKKIKQLPKSHKVEYIIDPYDEVRL